MVSECVSKFGKHTKQALHVRTIQLTRDKHLSGCQEGSLHCRRIRTGVINEEIIKRGETLHSITQRIVSKATIRSNNIAGCLVEVRVRWNYIEVFTRLVYG